MAASQLCKPNPTWKEETALRGQKDQNLRMHTYAGFFFIYLDLIYLLIKIFLLYY